MPPTVEALDAVPPTFGVADTRSAPEVARPSATEAVPATDTVPKPAPTMVGVLSVVPAEWVGVSLLAMVGESVATGVAVTVRVSEEPPASELVKAKLEPHE